MTIYCYRQNELFETFCRGKERKKMEMVMLYFIDGVLHKMHLSKKGEKKELMQTCFIDGIAERSILKKVV